MSDKAETHRVPVNVYRTEDRLTVAMPMPGMVSNEDIAVEVTADNRLIIHGVSRGALRDDKEVVLEEWSVGPCHRELNLPSSVDGELATVTYGNGVLVIALPIAERVRPARLSLEAVAPFRGERVGSAGHPIKPLTTSEHLAAQAALQAEHAGRRRRRKAD
jgi:HSP20 family protein